VGNDFYEKIRPELYRRIGRELSLARRVIDLGCGNCALADYLRKTYRQRVTGVDTRDGQMPRHDDPVRSRARMRCIQGDAARLTFVRDGGVDAIVSTWALHEMGCQRVGVLDEAYRVLRPGGRVLIVDFPRGSLAQHLWDEDYLTPDQVEALLTGAGFTRVRVRTVFKDQVIWAVSWRPPDMDAGE